MITEGRINLAKVQSGDGTTWMSLTITDQTSGMQFVSIKLDPQQFMDFMTTLYTKVEIDTPAPEFLARIGQPWDPAWTTSSKLPARKRT